MMNEIEIKERIAAITSDNFSNLELTADYQRLELTDSLVVDYDYFFITDVVMMFDAILDFDKADKIQLRFTSWDASFSMRSLVNVTGSTVHYAQNPTYFNYLVSSLDTLAIGITLTGNVSIFVGGYQVKIVV